MTTRTKCENNYEAGEHSLTGRDDRVASLQRILDEAHALFNVDAVLVVAGDGRFLEATWEHCHRPALSHQPLERIPWSVEIRRRQIDR